MGDRICGFDVRGEPGVSMAALASGLTKGGAVKPDKSPEKLASDLRKLVQPAQRVSGIVSLILPLPKSSLACSAPARFRGPAPSSCGAASVSCRRDLVVAGDGRRRE